MSWKADDAKGCSCEHHPDEKTDRPARVARCRSLRAGVCPVAFVFARMALSPLSELPNCNSANSRARKQSPGVFLCVADWNTAQRKEITMQRRIRSSDGTRDVTCGRLRLPVAPDPVTDEVRNALSISCDIAGVKSVRPLQAAQGEQST